MMIGDVSLISEMDFVLHLHDRHDDHSSAPLGAFSNFRDADLAH
jgi:hypothetical protein